MMLDSVYSPVAYTRDEYDALLDSYRYIGTKMTRMWSFDYNLDEKNLAPKITIAAKKVIFNPPATIILWTDGDKTVVKCSKNESFDPEKGIAMCMLKKLLTQDGYNKMRKEASNWIKERQVGDES